MCKSVRILGDSNIRSIANQDSRGIGSFYTSRDSDLASEMYARRRDRKNKRKGRDRNGEEFND